VEFSGPDGDKILFTSYRAAFFVEDGTGNARATRIFDVGTPEPLNISHPREETAVGLYDTFASSG
jgi:hypothetical protein